MPSSGVQKCALDRKSTRLNSSHTIISLVAVSLDRKSTRLNSSHTIISYAVFCLKKKTSQRARPPPQARLPCSLHPPRGAPTPPGPRTGRGGAAGARRCAEHPPCLFFSHPRPPPTPHPLLSPPPPEL